MDTAVHDPVDNAQSGADDPAIEPSTGRRRGVRFAVGVLVATIVLAVGAPLLGRGVLAGTDVLRTVPPWSEYTPSSFVYRHGPVNDTVDAGFPASVTLRDAVVHGHLQLWDPNPNGGTPLGSSPNEGLFSPLEWPLLLLGVRLGVAWSALLRLAAAAAGTFLLLRRLRISRFSAVCGGLVYATSGFIVAWTNWPQANIAALIPWLFLSADLVLEERRARNVLLLAAVTASMLLGGYPPVVVVTVYALVPFVLVRAWPHARHAGGWRAATREAAASGRLLAVAVTTGVGLAAFQLLPFVTDISSYDLTYRTASNHYGLPPAALLTSVFPWALGNPSSPSHLLTYPNFIDSFSFLGAAAAVFVGFALLRGRPHRVSRGVYRYCVTATTLMAIALYASARVGSDAPVTGKVKSVLWVLPGMDQVPVSRLRAPFLFLASLLAAFGVEHVASAIAPRTRRFLQDPWAIVRVVVVGGLAGYLVVSAVANERTLTWSSERSWVLGQSIVALLVAVATIGVIVAARVLRAPRRVVLIAVPLLLALEGLVVCIDVIPRSASADWYPTTPAITYLQRNLGHERFAASGDMLFPSASSYYGLRSVSGHSFQQPTWRDLVTGTSPGTYSLPTLTILGDGYKTASSVVLDRLGARFFVNDPDAIPYGLTTAPPATTGSTTVGGAVVARGSLPPGPLRAVDLRLVGPNAPRGTLDYLDVTIRDASGTAVARGERRFRGQAGTRDYFVAIAAEHLPTAATPWQVDVALRSDRDDHVAVATTAAGVIALGDVRPRDDGLELVHADAGAVIWRRLGALPRIRWASKMVVVPAAFDRIVKLQLGGLDANTVMLSEPAARASGKPARVHVLEDGPDEIRVRVDAAGSGYVVVADALQDGWKATVDGVGATLRDADHAVVAVHVGKGSHVVVLRAAPRGFALGRLITLATLAVVALFGVIVWCRRRRSAVTRAVP